MFWYWDSLQRTWSHGPHLSFHWKERQLQQCAYVGSDGNEGELNVVLAAFKWFNSWMEGDVTATKVVPLVLGAGLASKQVSQFQSLYMVPVGISNLSTELGQLSSSGLWCLQRHWLCHRICTEPSLVRFVLHGENFLPEVMKNVCRSKRNLLDVPQGKKFWNNQELRSAVETLLEQVYKKKEGKKKCNRSFHRIIIYFLWENPSLRFLHFCFINSSSIHSFRCG